MLWFPYAKINLGLAILNKRSDGFHTIESLLHPIKIFDILEIIESDRDELFLSGISLNISPEENLVWKAIRLLRKHYDFPSLKIHLHKQIPDGSGLGGGSSDATHTLLAVNQLFNLNISENTLVKLASEMGSDCPFFLKTKAQYAKGRGELLAPFELNINPLKLLLIIPNFSVSTKIAYSEIIAKTALILPKEVLRKPIEHWKVFLKNDFENIVFNRFPVLAEVKDKLYQNGAIYASLSGSGSGMYALFSKEITINLPKGYQPVWLDF